MKSGIPLPIIPMYVTISSVSARLAAVYLNLVER